MLKVYSSDQIIRLLRGQGFVFVSQKGSHVKYRKYGLVTRTVIVPAGRKEIPLGTLKSILRQAGLTERALNRAG